MLKPALIASTSLLLVAAVVAAQEDPSQLNTIDLRLTRTDYLTKWKPDLAAGVAGFAGHKFVFDETRSRLAIQGQEIELEQLSLRGQTCVMAERKCLSVKAKKAAEGSSKPKFTGSKPAGASDFNLISMWQDDGYTSNKLSYGLMNAIGLMQLKTNYAWLRVSYPSVNGRHAVRNAGLYLVTEKPGKVMKGKLDSPFIVRRGMDDKYEVDHPKAGDPSYAPFEAKYLELYAWARTLRGQELYDRVSDRQDLDGCFTWIAFNKLVRNQDAQDEIFLYADADAAKKGRLLLRVFPWDYDDVFQNEKTGALASAKKRYYRADTLDEAIRREPLFQRRYHQIQQALLERLSDSMLAKVRSDILSELQPYLREEILGVSSTLDRKDPPHTAEYVRATLDRHISEIQSIRDALKAPR